MSAWAAPLPPPAIVSPSSGAVVGDDAPLLWNAVPGASRYDVELCGDPACADVLGRSSVPNLYSLIRRPLGTLYWRVATVDAGGQRGAWSAITRFTVAHGISGTVYEDVNGDNDAAGLTPRPGVRVRLYKDGNENAIADTVTDKSGSYSFHPGTTGMYWVAVEAASVTPAAGASGPVRAEQTWGGAGAMCLQLDGSVARHSGDGSCFGGRAVNAPMNIDDPAHLSTSRHVARVDFTGKSVGDVDFAFSFNVVTSTADTATPGTLRQFLLNANAIHGPNAMHFVPVTKAPNGKWWSIRTASPLPALTDAGTTLDGTAYSIVDPKFVIDSNKETMLSVSNHVITGRKLIAPDRPELEVALSGDRGIDAGNAAAIRNMALGGARTNVIARGAVTLERAVVGARPDATPMYPAGEQGIVVEGGSARLDGVFISSQSNVGLAVRPGAALTAKALFVTRCGNENGGAGVTLASNDTTITDSFLYENDAPAVVVGGNEAAGAASRNAIRASAISHNRAGVILASNASGTIVEENDIVWNSEGGIVAEPGATPARLARISQNHFNENGGVPIDLQHQTEKNRLAPTTCHTNGFANEGLGAPQVTTAFVRHISDKARELHVEGRACPGTTVEIYESFVTGELREPIERERMARDLPSVREAMKTDDVESRDNAGGNSVDIIPSVGEFNFAISVKADANGTFTAAIPIVDPVVDPSIKPRPNLGGNDVELDVHDVFHGRRTYAVAAVAIDAAGNTSEFSRRHIVGDRSQRSER